MPKIIRHTTEAEFLEFNENYLYNNSITYAYIIQLLENPEKFNVKFDLGYTIIDDENNDLFIISLFWDDHRCMINRHNWNEAVINASTSTPEFINATNR